MTAKPTPEVGQLGSLLHYYVNNPALREPMPEPVPAAEPTPFAVIVMSAHHSIQ